MTDDTRFFSTRKAEELLFVRTCRSCGHLASDHFLPEGNHAVRGHCRSVSVEGEPNALCTCLRFVEPRLGLAAEMEMALNRVRHEGTHRGDAEVCANVARDYYAALVAAARLVVEEAEGYAEECKCTGCQLRNAIEDLDGPKLGDLPSGEVGKAHMIFIDGKSFRCSCAGNVFTRCGRIYKCNSCGTEYEGEPKK